MKQKLNSWATRNRIIPQDWKYLVTAVLEVGPQLQWKTWWREEAMVIDQQSRARGIELSPKQLINKGQYEALI